jgi:hypothetical protein
MLMTSLIQKAARTKQWEFARTLEELQGKDACVLKTHLHFPGELALDYKAVYMYDDVGASVASLWLLCLGREGRGFMHTHFQHLSVRPFDRFAFLTILRLSKTFAFLYMILGDKFRFEENMRSWRSSKNTIFVRYGDLIGDKEKTLRRVSDFLGIEINPGDFNVGARCSAYQKLPWIVRAALKASYPANPEEVFEGPS